MRSLAVRVLSLSLAAIAIGGVVWLTLLAMARVGGVR